MGVDVIKNLKRKYLLDLLKKNERIDGRDFHSFREIEVVPNVIDTAEGSALARIGETQVLAGIKFEIVEPFSSDPELGVFITNSEFLPLASSLFEPGPPDENSIEFARVVDRGLRSAEVVDLNSFFIEEGKVLGLFLDLYVLDYGGNLFDTGYLAAMSALLNTKMPKVEDGKIIRGEYKGNLDIKRVVTSTTFVKVDEYMIVDPLLSEELAADSRLTIAVTDEFVVAMQKGGSGGFKKSDVLKMVDITFDKRKEIMKYLR